MLFREAMFFRQRFRVDFVSKFTDLIIFPNIFLSNPYPYSVSFSSTVSRNSFFSLRKNRLCLSEIFSILFQFISIFRLVVQVFQPLSEYSALFFCFFGIICRGRIESGDTGISGKTRYCDKYLGWQKFICLYSYQIRDRNENQNMPASLSSIRIFAQTGESCSCTG